jgi:cullin 3
MAPQGIAGPNADVDKSWSAIETAFKEIHTKNVSALSYEEIYRHAYQVVLKKKGDDLYKRVNQFEHQWLSGESIIPHSCFRIPRLWAPRRTSDAWRANDT